jgi:hypothetical protein
MQFPDVSPVEGAPFPGEASQKMIQLPVGKDFPGFALPFASAMALVLAIGFIVSCVLDPQAKVVDSGGSSETTNGLVMGMVQDSLGHPAQNVRVVLRTRNFLKPAAPAPRIAGITLGETTTDGQGRYAFDSVAAGDYIVEASAQGKLGVIRDFSVGDSDTIPVGSLRMKPTGVLTGILDGPASLLSTAKVQIYGLDRIAFPDTATGKFIFPDIPEGSFTLRASALDIDSEAAELPDVRSKSSDTTALGKVSLATFEGEDYGDWPHSLRIQLNTTSSGAKTLQDVFDFPVLVRLNKGNFDFTLTNPRDVRFSDHAGRRLRYQIERWSTASQIAEIWVKLDTIHGNSHSDFINMHYGNPSSRDMSNGSKVFAMESGFGGVWHLGEEVPDTTTPGLYQDASPSRQNGDDRITSSETGGLIGRGHGFKLGDYIKSQPAVALRPTEEISITAWFQGTSTDSLASSIVSLGDSYGLRVQADGTVRFFIYAGKDVWFKASSQAGVLDSAWHYLAGSYDGEYLRVYIDGSEAGSIASNIKIPYTLGPDFYIGRHGTEKRDYDLTGSLDEVQIHGKSRSPDWIKLGFESQRINSTLLEFPSP